MHDMIREINVTDHFLDKQHLFRQLAAEYINCLDTDVGSISTIEAVSGLFDHISADFGEAFSDTFCCYIIPLVVSEKHLEICDGLIGYIFSHDQKLSRRKLYASCFKPNDSVALFAAFNRILFGHIQVQEPIRALHMFLNYYYKADGTYGENIWNSTEIKNITTAALNSTNDKITVCMAIANKLSYLYSHAQFKDPSYVTDQLELFVMVFEKTQGHNTINSLRSAKSFGRTKELVLASLVNVQAGLEYVTTAAFTHYFDLFQANDANRDKLNLEYNRWNNDISNIISTKMGITDFGIESDFFNIKEEEATIDYVTYRLSIEKMQRDLTAGLLASFDLSRSRHIANTCLDYLSMVFFSLHKVLKSDATEAIRQSDGNAVALYDRYCQDNPESLSLVDNYFESDTDSRILAELSKKHKEIVDFDIEERIYNFKTFKVTEKINIRFSDGQRQRYKYTGNLPFRYYNLLQLDYRIFDYSGFTFLGRQLDFLNGTLTSNTVDLILRNHTDSVGLLADIITGKKNGELLTIELLVNNQRTTFNLEDTVSAVPLPEDTENFFDYITNNKSIAEATKNKVAAAFAGYGHNRALFVSDGSAMASATEEVYSAASQNAANAILYGNLHAHAANAMVRLNILRTPGDAEVWVSGTQRRQISEKNAYRERLINNHLFLSRTANATFSDLIRFMTTAPMITTAVIPCFTICDYKDKKIHGVVMLNSPTDIHPWYVKNTVEVEETVIETAYMLDNLYENFFDKYRIDLSGFCKTGLRHMLELSKYLEDEILINNKFLYHGLNFNDSMVSNSWIGATNTEIPHKDRLISNKSFEQSCLLNNNLLFSQKNFLSNFFAPHLTLDHNSIRGLAVYVNAFAERLVAAQNNAVDNFNNSFEPKLHEWNDGYSISITIGTGMKSFGVISFSNTDYNIWIPWGSNDNKFYMRYQY